LRPEGFAEELSGHLIEGFQFAGVSPLSISPVAHRPAKDGESRLANNTVPRQSDLSRHTLGLTPHEANLVRVEQVE
jgi:hypothetical protein